MAAEAAVATASSLRRRRRRTRCHARGSRRAEPGDHIAALTPAARSAPALLAVASRIPSAIASRWTPHSRRRPTTSSASTSPPSPPPPAPAAFVGKLRADGVDLTKLRADLTKHHAALTKSYQASLRAELPQLAKLTGALGATDAELRRLCDRLAAHEEAASEHAAESASRLAAADAKRAEHAALAARAAQLRVLQRFADSLRTLEWLLGAEPDAIDLKAHEAVAAAAAGGGSGAPPPRLLCDAERLLRAGRELGRLEKLARAARRSCQRRRRRRARRSAAPH